MQICPNAVANRTTAPNVKKVLPNTPHFPRILKQKPFGRKYASHGCAAVTNWPNETYWPIRHCAQLSQSSKRPVSATKRPFLPCKKGCFDFQYGPYRNAIWPISQRDMTFFAKQRGVSRRLRGQKRPAVFLFRHLLPC